jgi:hypothetical protein
MAQIAEAKIAHSKAEEAIAQALIKKSQSNDATTQAQYLSALIDRDLHGSALTDLYSQLTEAKVQLSLAKARPMSQTAPAKAAVPPSRSEETRDPKARAEESGYDVDDKTLRQEAPLVRRIQEGESVSDEQLKKLRVRFDRHQEVNRKKEPISLSSLIVKQDRARVYQEFASSGVMTGEASSEASSSVYPIPHELFEALEIVRRRLLELTTTLDLAHMHAALPFLLQLTVNLASSLLPRRLMEFFIFPSEPYSILERVCLDDAGLMNEGDFLQLAINILDLNFIPLPLPPIPFFSQDAQAEGGDYSGANEFLMLSSFYGVAMGNDDHWFGNLLLTAVYQPYYEDPLSAFATLSKAPVLFNAYLQATIQAYLQRLARQMGGVLESADLWSVNPIAVLAELDMFTVMKNIFNYLASINLATLGSLEVAAALLNHLEGSPAPTKKFKPTGSQWVVYGDPTEVYKEYTDRIIERAAEQKEAEKKRLEAEKPLVSEKSLTKIKTMAQNFLAVIMVVVAIVLNWDMIMNQWNGFTGGKSL